MWEDCMSCTVVIGRKWENGQMAICPDLRYVFRDLLYPTHPKITSVFLPRSPRLGLWGEFFFVYLF